MAVKEVTTSPLGSMTVPLSLIHIFGKPKGQWFFDFPPALPEVRILATGGPEYVLEGEWHTLNVSVVNANPRPITNLNLGLRDRTGKFKGSISAEALGESKCAPVSYTHLKRVAVKKNLIEKMFGWMMPRGADKLALSKMHMGGIGLTMIKGIMRKKNVPSLPELIASAQSTGVRLVACSMSMDLMGIKREELIEGVEEGGVAMYLDSAESGNVNLFI